MLKISVEKSLLGRLRSFKLGVIQTNVICRNSSAVLLQFQEKQVLKVKEMYNLDNIKLIDNIDATREAYRKIGNDPNRYRPAADSLIRRIVKGLGLYSVNNVVDVLNLVSISSGYSISGFDSTKIKGQITLGIGNTGESYNGIGRGELNISNLPVLRDDNGAFGTPTSDSERTMITKDTKQILLVIYDFGGNPGLDGCISSFQDLLIQYCDLQEFYSDVFSYSIDI